MIAHEVGHQIEHANEEARGLITSFLNSRVGAEPLTQLAKKFEKWGFDERETGREDQFRKAIEAVYGKAKTELEKDVFAFYTGKKYNSGATEVMSIGMELLQHNAAEFAKADPEWFDLVVGVNTGRILPKTRAKIQLEYGADQ